MSDENKNRHLSDYLKGLPKVKSRDDFEQRLLMRLRNVESEKFSSPSIRKLTRKRFSILDLLRPSLIPAVGLTIVLLVFVVYYINISQKENVEKQISQNKEPVTTQNGIVDKQNKTSDSFISKNEQAPSLDNNLREKSNLQKSPESTVSSDFDGAPALGPERNRDFEEQISIPKTEDKNIDELKTETRESPALEDKKEAPMMKKSGELKFKDTEKQQNEDDTHLNGKGDVNDINRSVEQNQEKESLSKADSTKSVIRGNRKDKKKKNYNDTIKIPAEKEIQQEDSTKIR